MFLKSSTAKGILAALMVTIGFETQAQTKSENLFYMVDRPDSFKSFKENIDQISIVAPQNFRVSKEGVVTGTMDKRVMALAKQNGVVVMPLIVNKGFNPGTAARYCFQSDCQETIY